MLKFVRCTTIQHVKFFFATQTKINQFALNLSIDTTLIRFFIVYRADFPPVDPMHVEMLYF